ncbi:MAG: hypothetical protein DMF84_09645 [Acidobacteria bacterium]|nr:MAG: hypothetical protein DMF84_09645 [Acidobacteriota bacterium]
MSELTKRIRAKYPNAYNDLSDDELEQKVLAKHPQYADLADPKDQQPSVRVHMPDGRVINFPATMSHDEITKAIDQDFRPNGAPSRPALSREQYNAVRQRVINTAPDGLTRDQFSALMDSELTKAKTAQAESAVEHTEGKPDYNGVDNPIYGGAYRVVRGLYHYAKDHPAAAGAMAGSALAAPLTGGMSVPAAMAAVGVGGAGGAAYGQLAKGAATDDYGTPGGNAREIATEGGLSALGEGSARAVGAGARRIGPILRDQAVSAYSRMLKPTKDAIQSMTQYGATLPERAHNVAAAILDEGVNITQAGARKIHDRISQLADRASSIIANSDKRASTSYITDALGEARDRAAQQLAPGADVAAVDAVENSVRANPQITKRVRGRKLLDTGVLDASGQPVMKR